MLPRFISGLGVGLALLLGVGRLLAPSSPLPPPPSATDYDSEGLTAADYQRLSDYDGRVAAWEMRAALVVIDPHDTLAPFFVEVGGSAESGNDNRNAPGGIALLAEPNGEVLARVDYRSGADPSERDIETVDSAEPAGPIDPIRPRPPLKGLRILIDPGHFGGAWSEIEERHWIVNDRDPVREGNLNWGTAQLVKAGLEEAGATVILSRAAPPDLPFPALDLFGAALDSPALLLAWLWRTLGKYDLVDWLAARPVQLELFFDAARGARYDDETSFYRVFSRFDLRRRGLLSAEVGADLSLSLHYNVSKRASLNRVVVFLPGFVVGDEWQSASARYYALRRALEGDMPLLKGLALDVSRNMQDRLRVPARQYPKRVDAQKLPIYPEHGVFARNLGFLRRSSGPALLIEGPCMNNPAENARLLREEIEIDGQPYPKRVRQYANAVIDAVRKNAGALHAQQIRCHRIRVP